MPIELPVSSLPPSDDPHDHDVPFKFTCPVCLSATLQPTFSGLAFESKSINCTNCQTEFSATYTAATQTMRVQIVVARGSVPSQYLTFEMDAAGNIKLAEELR